MTEPTITTIGPRGETYQRKAMKKELEKVMERCNHLPPSAESQAMHDALNAAYAALRQAQRKYGEI